MRLESAALSKWARVITGIAPDWLPAIEIEVPALTAAEPSAEPNASRTKANDQPVDKPDNEPFDPYRQVELFRATASPLTQKLAGLLASVPLTLPIIRLVQNALLPKSELLHLSEFLTSGLVYRVVSGGSRKPVADEILFEFYEGVRILLRRTVTIPDTVDVLNKVGEFIQKRETRGQTFAALAPNATGTDSLIFNDRTMSFAHLNLRAEVLDSLGPIYRPAAERLRQQIDELTADAFADLQPFTFDIVEFVEEEETKLPEFDFEYVTVDASGQEIARRSASASYFAEALDPAVQLEMVAIPGGSFEMGSPANEPKRRSSEDPQHSVTVPPFFMGKYPVTQAQWKVVAAMGKVKRELDSYPAEFKRDDRPVEKVNWYDAVEFCERLSQHTGRTYRLPSEAEWEYACRAGTTTPFHFGETITTELANYNGSVYRQESEGKRRGETTPVGSFLPNAFGLYDMHGNVWEWCADHWHSNYEGAPIDGSAWIEGGDASKRFLRGGSWFYDPQYCRSAYRNHNAPVDRYNKIGFRVVCSASRTS